MISLIEITLAFFCSILLRSILSILPKSIKSIKDPFIKLICSSPESILQNYPFFFKIHSSGLPVLLQNSFFRTICSYSRSILQNYPFFFKIHSSELSVLLQDSFFRTICSSSDSFFITICSSDLLFRTLCSCLRSTLEKSRHQARSSLTAWVIHSVSSRDVVQDSPLFTPSREHVVSHGHGVFTFRVRPLSLPCTLKECRHCLQVVDPNIEGGSP